ncbi:MAG: hypothetical protein ABTD50_11105 [Polyangiaceae bacterium]|jgi:hypothetical protein
MSAKSPLALVKEKFGDKSKLVEAIRSLAEGLWIARVNESKGLEHVSNAKLLRLHATFSEVKERFGTRDKLIEAVLEQQSRVKDAGLRSKLELWPVPRLYDTYRSASKRLRDEKAKGAAALKTASASHEKGEKKKSIKKKTAATR